MSGDRTVVPSKSPKLSIMSRESHVPWKISCSQFKESKISDFKHNIRLSVQKPLHARAISESFEHFKSPERKGPILSGWRGYGIISAVQRY
jgi:hypothetical protein